MELANRAACSNYALLLVVHRIGCGKRVRVLVRCNCASMSSRNFSCRGCVGKVLGASFHTQGRMVSGILRNLAVIQTGDEACRCFPKSYYLQGKSLSGYADHLKSA